MAGHKKSKYGQNSLHRREPGRRRRSNPAHIPCSGCLAAATDRNREYPGKSKKARTTPSTPISDTGPGRHHRGRAKGSPWKFNPPVFCAADRKRRKLPLQDKNGWLRWAGDGRSPATVTLCLQTLKSDHNRWHTCTFQSTIPLSKKGFPAGS